MLNEKGDASMLKHLRDELSVVLDEIVAQEAAKGAKPVTLQTEAGAVSLVANNTELKSRCGVTRRLVSANLLQLIVPFFLF